MTVVTKQDSIAAAGVVTFGGTVTNAALTFLMTGIIGNALGTARTGLFFQATAIFSIAASLLVLGADTALVRALSRERALERPQALIPTTIIAFVPVLTVSVVAAGALWFAAPGLAEWLSPSAAEETELLVRSLAPFLPAAPLLGLVLGTCRGLGSYYPYTLLQNILVPVSRVAALAVVTAGSAQLEHVTLAWAAPLSVAVLIGVPILMGQLRRAAGTAVPAERTWRRSDQVHMARLRGRFWSFALPRGGATLIERALDWSDVLIVIALAGPSEGGVYAVVTRCAGVGYLLENAARIVTGPKVSHALARGDMDEARRLFADVTRVLILASWPFYWTLVVFASPVLRLFGPGFESGAAALSVISVAMMLATSAGMLQSFLLMGGRSHWQLMNRSVQLATLVALCLVLVPAVGIVGAALAWAAAVLVDAALAGVQVARRMSVRSSPRLIARPCLVAGGVFGLGGWAFRALLGESLSTTVVSILVCGTLYAVLCHRWQRELGLASFLGRA